MRAGSNNLLREPALAPDEVRAAIEVGATVAHQLIDQGADLLGVGEVGIANTTAAAALIALFTARPASGDRRPRHWPRRCGCVAQDRRRHRRARARAKDIRPRARSRPFRRAPRRHYAVARLTALAALAEVGGLEIAAMVGFIRAGVQRQRLVVLDGFVTNAAALLACALDPEIRHGLLASHRSAELGAGHALATLGLSPLLDLQLRLGEGTGAVIAMALVRTAVAAETNMATFATAGILPRPT